MSDLDDLALQGVTCPFCGARPGHWCVTARPYRLAPGRRTTWLHADRTDLLREAWRIGRDQGVAQTYGAVAQRLQAALDGSFWARDTPTDAPGIARWLQTQADRARG